MKRISTFIIAATIMVLTGLCAEAEVIDRVMPSSMTTSSPSRISRPTSR
jgi:predicted benzoate:H+ symporter BenE